jgi:Pyruvate/2-oxoacid:ferredoxin oxidoreductase delta subunit
LKNFQGFPLADIISIDKKLDLVKDKKAALIRRRKVLAVQKVFQCTHCALKCEKCGIQIEHGTEPGTKYRRNLRVPYNFCQTCSEDYIDYIERLQGKENSDCFWHNDAWLDAWTKWIEYQSSIDRYIKSKEFRRLLDELKQRGPE